MTDPPPRDIRRGVALASRTTLGVGGPARYHLVGVDVASIADAHAWALRRALPVAFVGGGSNLLVADDGFDGLVVEIAIRGRRVMARRANEIELEIAAGEPWSDVVDHAVAEGWAGIECLAGIPGRAGAAPIQNIGAYGQEVGEVVRAVHVLDPISGRTDVIGRDACAFGYRTSRFKNAFRGSGPSAAITGLLLALRPGGRPTVRYAELERVLRSSGGGEPDLARVSDAVLDLRRQKSMVYEPDHARSDPNRRSAGSFFLNPVVDTATADAIAVLTTPEMPRWPVGPYRVKLSAAWLIEQAGFRRGHTVGRVGQSSNHALAIINLGGASAGEVVDFAARIRRDVRSRFGIALEPEPVFLGFGAPSAAVLDGI